MDKIIDIKQGDALELFKSVKDNSIDLIVADPPYNLNKDYGNNSDSRSFDEYIKFTVIGQCKKADPQMAHLVFPDTRANAQKTKRAIFCQRTDRRQDIKK
jgi:DNA modification methylase